MASELGDEEGVKSLLAKGTDAKSLRDEDGGTCALWRAASEGHLAVIKLLLNAGALVDGVGQQECTPLSVAAERGRTEVVKLLLTANASLRIQSSLPGLQ